MNTRIARKIIKRIMLEQYIPTDIPKFYNQYLYGKALDYVFPYYPNIAYKKYAKPLIKIIRKYNLSIPVCTVKRCFGITRTRKITYNDFHILVNNLIGLKINSYER